MNIKEYKIKLGKRAGCMVLPSGKETLSITKFENGMVLKKRGNQIVLDRFSMWAIRDEIDRFEKKLEIINKLK